MPQLRDAFRREKETRREIDEKVRSEAMRTTAEEAGYMAIFASTDEDAGRTRDLVFKMLAKEVDGIILVPCAACPFPEIAGTLAQIALYRGPVTLAAMLALYTISVFRKKGAAP